MASSKVADFALPTSAGGTFRLSDYSGKDKGTIVVLYFYPKDSTPGCTTEGIDVAALHDHLVKANGVFFG